MKMTKVVASLAVFALLAGSLPVEARIGGSSSTSSSSSSRSSSSSLSSSYSKSSSSSSSRLGGGGSVGMSRSDVTAQARQQSQGTTARNYGNVGAAPRGGYYQGGSGYRAPSPSYTPSYSPSYQPPAQRPGYSGAAVAGAAVAGAAVGALANQALNSNHNAPVIVNNGVGGAPSAGYAPQGGHVSQGGYVPQGGAPVVMAAPSAPAAPMAMAAPMVPTSSGFGFGWFLLMLLVLGGLGYAMYRYLQGSKSPSYVGSSGSTFGSHYDDDEEHDLSQARQLLSQAPALFRELQDVNNRGDKVALARLTTPDLYDAFAADIDTRSTPSQTQVMSLQVEGNEVRGFVRESGRYVGSIHFRGLLKEGSSPANDEVDEVWHFVKDLSGGQWKLAGIEQV